MHVRGDPQTARFALRHRLQADSVRCAPDGVGFAVGVAEHLVPDARQLGGDRVSVSEPPVCPAHDEPFRIRRLPNVHVLPQTLVPLVRVCGITKVDTEVELHAQEVVAGTPRTEGADFSLHLCKVFRIQHIRILGDSLNPLKLVTSATADPDDIRAQTA